MLNMDHYLIILKDGLTLIMHMPTPMSKNIKISSFSGMIYIKLLFSEIDIIKHKLKIMILMQINI